MRSIRPLLGSSAVVLAACAQSSPAPPPGPAGVDTLVVVDTLRIETEAQVNAELEDRVASLQIQVLERDVQLEELQRQLDATRLELVRNMARLQTQASRAEAASGMSEAEIALATLQRAPGGSSLPELQRAEELFAESTTEFENDNYGGALYLATEVRTAVRSGQARLGGGSLRDGETLFAVPVPLQTTGRSNVRAGPGLDYEVVFTADAAAPLTGQSRTSQWVRVVDRQGLEGWIFHTLVTSR
jgi:hypothetical protein